MIRTIQPNLCITVTSTTIKKLVPNLRTLQHFLKIHNEFDLTYCLYNRAMLSMGLSRPWQEAMEVITGQQKMDASALVEYFKPLEKWLVEKNKELGVETGWSIEGTPCQKGDFPATSRQPKELEVEQKAEVVQQQVKMSDGKKSTSGQSALMPCFSLIILSVLSIKLP